MQKMKSKRLFASTNCAGNLGTLVSSCVCSTCMSNAQSYANHHSHTKVSTKICLSSFFPAKIISPLSLSFLPWKKSPPANLEPSVLCAFLLTKRYIFRLNCCFTTLLQEQIKAQFVPLFPFCRLSECLYLKAFAWIEPSKWTRNI